MNYIKKYLGIVWLLLAPAVIYFLVDGAVIHIDPEGKKDINNPVIWVIIITIFTPIAIFPKVQQKLKISNYKLTIELSTQPLFPWMIVLSFTLLPC